MSAMMSILMLSGALNKFASNNEIPATIGLLLIEKEDKNKPRK